MVDTDVLEQIVLGYGTTRKLHQGRHNPSSCKFESYPRSLFINKIKKMYIYNTYDVFDRQTGKKISTEKRVETTLCDFTGNEIEEEEIQYRVDYNNIDPCVGCSDIEEDLCEKYPEIKDYLYEILLAPFIVGHPYKLKQGFVKDLKNKVKKILDESDDYFILNNVFRDIKAETIKKLLDSGKYTVEQFLPY